MAAFNSSGGGVRFTAGDGTPVQSSGTPIPQFGIGMNGLGQIGGGPADLGGAFGGIQSDPRNESIWAQMAAQRPATPPGIPSGSGGPSSIGRPGGPSASGGFGGGGLAQGVNLSQYQQNPYLPQMADTMRGQMMQNLERNVLPGIRSNAIAAGGFGGSRQGVVEANALNDANRTLNDSITGMYYGDYNNQMGRNLQKYGMDQGYSLGQGQLALGNQNSMQNFYTANRGQDLQQTALGADLFQRGNNGFLSQGQGIYGLGTTQQQAPWQVINNGNAGFGQWSGFGTTTQAGGGAQGMLGGALAGGQLGSLWGGTVGTPAPTVGSNWSTMNSTAAPWSLGQSTGGNGGWV